MITSDDASLIQQYYSSADSFLILLSPTPSFDQVASALGLHLALQNQKKAVEVICPEPMRVEFSNLVGVDQVKSVLGNRSLKVTFPYDSEKVENVSYHIDKESGQFHLFIKPPKGEKAPDPTQVEYSHVGVDVDTIFLIGVSDWSDINPYYETEEQALTSANTIAIHAQKPSFAKVNIESQAYSSYSEWSFTLLEHLNLDVSSDIATNLFCGIEKATDSFRSARAGAEAFATCAKLLKAGARRPKAVPTSTNGQKSVSSLAEAFSKQQKKQPVAKNGVSTQPSQFAPMAR